MSSKKELCSEYGTPYTCRAVVELRIGWRLAWENVLLWERDITAAMVGKVAVPLGGVKL